MSQCISYGLSDSIEAPRKIHGNFSVDEAVVAHFPPVSRLVSATTFGVSAWTVTARLEILLPGGAQKSYFLKCATEETGRTMVEGEFKAMSELYQVTPDFVPGPHSWGKYRAEGKETYFLLMDFIEMKRHDYPDAEQLCTKLALLHEKSVSPNGKFGFHVRTCQGRTPQAVEWESSWEVFFTKLLRHVLELNTRINGRWEELEVVSDRIISKVIPRLIGALERDGRSVKPCLIHGDLWEGNTGISAETGDIYVFDSAAFYAHNEMETGNWRCNYNNIHEGIYRATYVKMFPASEPQAEWDDRNRMYSIYYNIIYSVNHKGDGMAARQMAYDDMYFLVDSYAPFAPGSGPPRLTQAERVALPEEKDHTRN